METATLFVFPQLLSSLSRQNPVLIAALCRYGEMDWAKWWNTSGLLGRAGGVAVSRGLPKSHPFARARAVFAVARSRCREVYSPSESITLWELPPEIELAFEDRWSHWLDTEGQSSDLFTAIQQPLPSHDLLSMLQALGCVDNNDVDAAKQLKRAADQRAVPIGGVNEVNDSVVALLAAGFHRGEVGSLAVPYARLERGK